MTRLEELLLDWQDRSISPEGVAELKSHLALPAGRAAAAREFFLTGVLLESLQVQQAADDEVSREPTPNTSPEKVWRRIALGSGSLAACLLIALFVWRPRDNPAPAPTPGDPIAFAQVEQSRGEIFLVSDQKVHPALSGQVIAPGDGIATEGVESEAVVNMADEVRLTLGGDTTVFTTLDNAQLAETKLVLEKGDLRIDVNRSLKRKTTTIQTRLGSVTAEADETSLHLSEAVPVLVVRGEVRYQHKATGEVIRLRQGEYLAMDATGAVYASQVFSGNGRLWTTFPRTGLNTTSQGYALVFSPKGSLASVSRVGEGEGRSGPVQREEPRTFKGERCVQFSPDGQWLATADDADVVLYRSADLTAVRRLPGKDRRARVQCLAFSPDGKTLAVGRAALKDPAALEIWDLATDTLRHTFNDHTATIHAVVFSSDGKRLASGGLDRTTILRNTEGFMELARLVANPSQVVWSLAFAPQGDVLAIASGPADFRLREGGEVALWDFAADRVTSRLTGHTRGATSVVFSRDGQTLITGSADATVRFWDRATSRQYGLLKGHNAAPGFEAIIVALSPDGSALATASFDQTVRIWPTSWIRVVNALRNDRNTPGKG